MQLEVTKPSYPLLKTYNCLQFEGFTHFTVNHTYNFLDPDTSPYTDCGEGSEATCLGTVIVNITWLAIWLNLCSNRSMVNSKRGFSTYLQLQERFIMESVNISSHLQPDSDSDADDYKCKFLPPFSFCNIYLLLVCTFRHYNHNIFQQGISWDWYSNNSELQFSVKKTQLLSALMYSLSFTVF